MNIFNLTETPEDNQLLRERIEEIYNKKEEEKFIFIERIIPYPGHTVFEIDTVSYEICQAEIIEEKITINWFDMVKYYLGDKNEIPSQPRKKLLMKGGKVYISALNPKNAVKRLIQDKGSAKIN